MSARPRRSRSDNPTGQERPPQEPERGRDQVAEIRATAARHAAAHQPRYGWVGRLLAFWRHMPCQACAERWPCAQYAKAAQLGQASTDTLRWLTDEYPQVPAGLVADPLSISPYRGVA